jgi:hypothetical protein
LYWGERMQGSLPHLRKHWLWLRRGVIFALCVVVCCPAVARAAQATLAADAHVNSAMPTVNSGAISNLDVGGGYTTLLQFDLSMLPPGTTATQVTRAVLRVYANRVTTPGLVTLAPVAASWGEYSVTYATQPALGSPAGVFTVSEAGAFVAVDVTSMVQGWITAPATNDGVALSAGSAVVQFDSKENDETAHPATLEVDLANAGPAGATGAAGPMGPQGLAGVAGPSGPAGPIGLTGATGAMGLQGLQGVAGAAGPAGPAGPQGLQGPAGPAGPAGVSGTGSGSGLVYQGTYDSTHNYALGDVAVWQGSSYTSLIASNHGNTPSFSPQQWGILAAQGPAGPAGASGAPGVQGPQGLPGSVGPNGPVGPQGLQGIAGQAGAQGIPGATGATGLSGPMGPQGVAGPVGLSFNGIYSSVTNYALADGVSYNGAGYVSLVASNHGNTPDQSPQQWSLFAAAGATGATGPAGSTGPAGPIGPTGLQGMAGMPGATGATGPQGPPVANYLGNYQSTVNYALNDAVSWQGSTYVSLVAGNHGNTPSLSPAQWAVLAAQGLTGATGAAGATGATGPAGAAGATGATGAQGPAMTFQGGWLIGTQYALGDAVSYAGSAYIALTANLGREPDMSPQYWGLLAAAGAAGPAGATGATGLQGPTGYAGQQGPVGPQGLTGPAGAVGPAGATGATGAAGPVGPTGAAGLPGIIYLGAYTSATNYGLNDSVTYQGSTYISLSASNLGNTPPQSPGFWSVLAMQGAAGQTGTAGATGPQGPAGLPGAAGAAGTQGPAGPAGANGMSYRSGWTASAGYAVNDAVSFDGTTYIAQSGNTSNEPDLYPQTWAVLAQAGSMGPTGPAGSSGAAATIAIGTVSTGAAGSQAAVTNSGSAANAILNFTLPQGAAGSSGGGGGSGSGLALSAYHDVSYANLYFSTSSSASSPSELSPVLTWVPAGCTASALNVYSLQSNTITVTLRTGTPGSMANTTLACTASTGSSCSATGGVTVAPGGFVDLNITGASGTTAGVWTSLSCN